MTGLSMNLCQVPTYWYRNPKTNFVHWSHSPGFRRNSYSRSPTPQFSLAMKTVVGHYACKTAVAVTDFETAAMSVPQITESDLMVESVAEPTVKKKWASRIYCLTAVMKIAVWVDQFPRDSVRTVHRMTETVPRSGRLQGPQWPMFD